ncbi:hypothetical protein N7536_000161 [Penicillium majusculum]|nr:hypothetical protein N7536_000161 [Penicillium majusculum]
MSGVGGEDVHLSMTRGNSQDVDVSAGGFRTDGQRVKDTLRCHSCNRAETPEWRRGPDGARTLCNACGLHYARLSKAVGSNRAIPASSNVNEDANQIRIGKVRVLSRDLSFTKQTLKWNLQTRKDRKIMSLTNVKTKLSH